MFERFTERARQVVVLAQDEARVLRHNYIGTEHLLLGLMREEEGVGAQVLESLDLTVEEARAWVARTVGEGDELTSGQIPFTPRAKKVLELSLREALSLGDNYIGTEHILLGLVRENDGVASRILLEFGADANTVRDQVIRLLSKPGRPREPMPSHRQRLTIRPRGWEYRVERWPSDTPEGTRQAELNTLARDGWELTAAVPVEGGAEWVFRRPGPARPRVPGLVWTTALIGEGGYKPATIADVENAVVARRKSVEESGDDERYADITAFEQRLDHTIDSVTEVLRGTLEVTGTTVIDELVDRLREEKEGAIEAQDFQRAAHLRDLERKLVTVLRDMAAVLREKPAEP